MLPGEYVTSATITDENWTSAPIPETAKFCPHGTGTFSTNSYYAFCKVPTGEYPASGESASRGMVRKAGIGGTSYRGWFNEYLGYPYGCGVGCLKVTCSAGTSVYLATINNQANGPHIGDLWDQDQATINAIAALGGKIEGGNLLNDDGATGYTIMVCEYEEVSTSICWEEL